MVQNQACRVKLTIMTNRTTNRKHYTVAFKAQSLQQILREDKTLVQIAFNPSVHPNIVSHWKATALQELLIIFERDKGAHAAEKAALDKQAAQLYLSLNRTDRQINYTTDVD